MSSDVTEAETVVTEAETVEVWVRETREGVFCMVVKEDERTDDLDVYAHTVEGAAREITGYFMSQGYEPVGGWEWKNDFGNERVRTFKRK